MSLRTVVVVLLGSGLLACSGGARRDKHTRVGDTTAGRVPGRVVVDFRDGTSAAVLAERAAAWGVSLRFNSLVGPEDGVALADGVQDVDALLKAIRQSPDVEAAEPLLLYEAQGFTPNDPEYPKQWNLRMIGMEEAWEMSRGKGVVVAVLDTGVAYETKGRFIRVPDLKGVHFAPGYDFVHDTDHPNDDNGHGTHVAGTIAQATNNGEGVAGIAFEATLMPIKVLDAAGTGTSADIADGIRWAVDHGAKVLNLSLGGFGYSRVIENAVAYARRQGAVVVAAAGNHGDGTVAYPAAYAGAVGVGAVGPDGTRTPYSAWGEQLDLLAPGGRQATGRRGWHPPGHHRAWRAGKGHLRLVPRDVHGHAARGGRRRAPLCGRGEDARAGGNRALRRSFGHRRLECATGPRAPGRGGRPSCARRRDSTWTGSRSRPAWPSSSSCFCP